MKNATSISYARVQIRKDRGNLSVAVSAAAHKNGIKSISVYPNRPGSLLLEAVRCGAKDSEATRLVGFKATERLRDLV